MKDTDKQKFIETICADCEEPDCPRDGSCLPSDAELTEIGFVLVPRKSDVAPRPHIEVPDPPPKMWTPAEDGDQTEKGD